MKIKIIIAFIAAIGTLGLTGCKPKETTLSGQIFIVTRGSENIKLGLVEVQLIEKQQAIDFLKKRQVAIDLEIASRQREYAVAKSEDEKSAADFNTFQTNSPLTKSDYVEMKDRRTTLLQDTAELDRKNSPKMQRLHQLTYELKHFEPVSPAIGESSVSAALASLKELQTKENEAKQILESLNNSICLNCA